MFTEKQIELELEKAEEARRNGNEGMARVCARRAAGIVTRKFLMAHKADRPSLNNLELLTDQDIRNQLPHQVWQLLDHLTMKVDINYNLPDEVDLILETRELIQLLLTAGVKNHGKDQ